MVGSCHDPVQVPHLCGEPVKAYFPLGPGRYTSYGESGWAIPALDESAKHHRLSILVRGWKLTFDEQY